MLVDLDGQEIDKKTFNLKKTCTRDAVYRQKPPLFGCEACRDLFYSVMWRGSSVEKFVSSRL